MLRKKSLKTNSTSGSESPNISLISSDKTNTVSDSNKSIRYSSNIHENSLDSETLKSIEISNNSIQSKGSKESLQSDRSVKSLKSIQEVMSNKSNNKSEEN